MTQFKKMRIFNWFLCFSVVVVIKSLLPSFKQTADLTHQKARHYWIFSYRVVVAVVILVVVCWCLVAQLLKVWDMCRSLRERPNMDQFGTEPNVRGQSGFSHCSWGHRVVIMSILLSLLLLSSSLLSLSWSPRSLQSPDLTLARVWCWWRGGWWCLGRRQVATAGGRSQLRPQ